MVEKKTINLNYIREVTGDDDEVLKEFIMLFFDQLPEFKIGLHEHLNNKDYKKLGELAHKAKSSVMTFGMDNLGWRLKDLQLKTQKLEDVDSYPKYVEEFDEVISDAEKELQEILENIQ